MPVAVESGWVRTRWHEPVTQFFAPRWVIIYGVRLSLLWLLGVKVFKIFLQSAGFFRLFRGCVCPAFSVLDSRSDVQRTEDGGRMTEDGGRRAED